jgi:predicted P-loop ATPase
MPRDASRFWVPYVKCFQAVSIRVIDASGDLIAAEIFEAHVRPAVPTVKDGSYEEDGSSELDSSDADYEYFDSEEERRDGEEMLAEMRKRTPDEWVDEDEDIDSDFARQAQISNRVILQVRSFMSSANPLQYPGSNPGDWLPGLSKGKV